VIVTNYHVIRAGNVAAVKFSDDSVLPVDGVLAADKARDLAIIKVHGKTFRTLTLGNSDQIEIGEEVVAIGNPQGLELTVSNGILSGVRTVEREGGNFLQITAPISHGSSGGPLFNMRGEVIGITSMYFEGGENLNFAIPVNDAKSLLQNRSANLQNLPDERESASAAKPERSRTKPSKNKISPDAARTAQHASVADQRECWQQAHSLGDDRYTPEKSHYDPASKTCYVQLVHMEAPTWESILWVIEVKDAFEGKQYAVYSGVDVKQPDDSWERECFQLRR